MINSYTIANFRNEKMEGKPNTSKIRNPKSQKYSCTKVIFFINTQFICIKNP